MIVKAGSRCCCLQTFNRQMVVGGIQELGRIMIHSTLEETLSSDGLKGILMYNKTVKSVQIRTLVLFLLMVSFTGCQGGVRHTSKPIEIINATAHVSLSNEAAVTRSLNAQLKEWKAVRYNYGGMSKRGVDCSGFVYLTYLSYFGVELPRTASQQAELGQAIPQRHLRPGDLVFFKTGRITRHVGIYVEGRHFIHASKSQGVIRSSLDDDYWAARYWKAKRMNREQSTT